MVKKARKKDKRKGKTSFIIIDAQSVKNTDTAKHRGYDAGKKVSGIKRHIAVDSQGFTTLLTGDESAVYADSAYKSQDHHVNSAADIKC